MKRRSFLKGFAMATPAVAAPEALFAQLANSSPITGVHVVGAGQDRFGHPHATGFSSMAFKVASGETGGGLLMIEYTHLAPGGPPLHLHHSQEEFFYVMEGSVAFQIGEQRLELKPGECVLAPRAVPHTFSATQPNGRLLTAFTPAGKMESYFRDADTNRPIAFDPAFMRRYDMELVGPSPFWKS